MCALLERENDLLSCSLNYAFYTIGGKWKPYIIWYLNCAENNTMKHVATYRQFKPVYDRYKASRDKEKFLRGHESEIILFEAAARECKRLGAVPLPAAERMQAEMDELNARKAVLKAELQKAQRDERDYAAMRRNVEDFLSQPQPEQERKKNVELE